MNLSLRVHWTAAAAIAVAAASAIGLTLTGAAGGTASAAAAGQKYDVPCPAADQVTPALNANLVANPGAEDVTPLTSLGAPSDDGGLAPDCWTSSSPLNAPEATLTSNPYSSVPAPASLSDVPDPGSYFFWGGNDYDGVSLPSTTTTATQLVDVSPLNPGGLPFELSAWLGGYTRQTDSAVVTATFQDASGTDLGSASIGPVTESQRGGVTELLPQARYGTVPAGTVQVLVTVASTGAGRNINGLADDLNLTIGSSAVATQTLLQTLPYTAPKGSDGGLYRPAGVSADDGAAYVSNTGDNVVSVLESGNTTVIAGSPEGSGEHGDGLNALSATLYQPGGSAEDAEGDIFIADSADNVVREITPDGVIQRFAGTGIAGGALRFGQARYSELDHPEAVAVNASGDVFVADTYNNRVLEVTPRGHIKVVAGDGRAGYRGDNGPGIFAELNQPAGVAVDARGNLYIADSASNVIRRVDAATGIITTVAGDYAADQAGGGLGGFSGDGGLATSARLNDPQGVAVDGAGDLFIADTFNNAIREVTPAGLISTVVNHSKGGAIPAAGGESSGKAPTTSRLNSPYAVAVDQSTGVLYIADTGNSEIAEVLNLTQAGDAAGPVAPPAQS
jgi:hypothetical protein